MTGMTPRVFQQQDGVAGWHVVDDGACAVFATTGFGAGVAWAGAAVERTSAIAGAEAVWDRASIDICPRSIAVRIGSFEAGVLDAAVAGVARSLSGLAAEYGFTIASSQVRAVQLMVDVADPAAVLPFWEAVLGYRRSRAADLTDPRAGGPAVWFRSIGPRGDGGGRVRVGVSVPRTDPYARIDAAIAAGGSVVDAEHAPEWWTLADPEGNEVELAAWLDGSDFVWEA